MKPSTDPRSIFSPVKLARYGWRGWVRPAVVVALAAIFLSQLILFFVRSSEVHSASSTSPQAARPGPRYSVFRPAFSEGISVVHDPRVIFGHGSDLVLQANLPVPNPRSTTVCFGKVEASCGCSQAELAKPCIAPGESGALHLEVKMPPDGGQRDLLFVLRADDGSTDRHTLQLTAYPHVQVMDEFGSLSFGKVAPGKPATLDSQINLHARTSDELPSIESVECLSPDASIRTGTASKAVPLPGNAGLRRTVPVHLTLKPQGRPGVGSGDIQVHYTVGSKRENQHINVSWEVTEHIRFRPARVFALVRGESADSVPLVRSVKVTAADGRQFEVTSAKCEAKWLHVASVRPIDDGDTQIDLEIDLSKAPDRGTINVEVVTTHPVQAGASLPVTVFKR